MAVVLAAVDFSPVTDAVCERAVVLSKALELELVLLHVAADDPEFVGYEPGPDSVRSAVAGHLRDAHRQLQARASALSRDGLAVRPLTVQGPIVERILEHAERLDAAWLVLGSHGHGKLYDLLVGSVADGVLRRSKVPTVMVPARPR
ncbi:MAG: universal stress protein [Polyangiaceae bacterium]